MIGAVLLGAFAAATRIARGPAPVLDMNLAAVMPFRVAGGDASMEGLGEGMVDLLAMRLADERGVRAADARAAMSAWARAGGDDAADPVATAGNAARALGAGRVITGSIVISGRKVTLGATLLPLDRPGARPHAESITGDLDSLLYLVDGLAVALLAREAGLEQQRLGGLTSLPALQAFLAGKAAHRRGQYAEAIAQFQRSLEADSTFALAALVLNISARRTSEQFALWVPALDQAFRHRDQLSVRDRALLDAFWPGYPAWPSILETVAAFEAFVDRWPDDADAWFELGDQLLHFGGPSGIPDHVRKAELAFHRAIALDSTFYLPYEHLLVALLEQQDVAGVRTLWPRVQQIGIDAARQDYLRWRVGLALGDSAGVRGVAARLETMNPLSRRGIAGDAQWLGARLEDAERAIAIARARAATKSELTVVLDREHDLALNRGMVRRAAGILAQMPPPYMDRDLEYLHDALFSEGDRETAEAAAARLRALAAGSDSAVAPWQRAQIDCELAWWDLARGNLDAAETVRRRLRTATATSETVFNSDDVTYCGAIIDAAIATLRRRPNATELIQHADSINIYSATTYWQFGNMVTARLKERTGDLAGALASWRRVAVLGAPDIVDAHVSTYLREVARLALATGDTRLAREYYGRYVGLRASADSALQPDVARARAELERLAAESVAR
jgi:tetratricopeptide (TPR) repeat protein